LDTLLVIDDTDTDNILLGVALEVLLLLLNDDPFTIGDTGD